MPELKRFLSNSRKALPVESIGEIQRQTLQEFRAPPPPVDWLYSVELLFGGIGVIAFVFVLPFIIAAACSAVMS